MSYHDIASYSPAKHHINASTSQMNIIHAGSARLQKPGPFYCSKKHISTKHHGFSSGDSGKQHAIHHDSYTLPTTTMITVLTSDDTLSLTLCSIDLLAHSSTITTLSTSKTSTTICIQSV